jgi:hypothetical protein
MRILVSLLVLVGLCNTPTHVKRYVMEPNVFLGYLKRGIACLMILFGHIKIIAWTKIIQPMVL